MPKDHNDTVGSFQARLEKLRSTNSKTETGKTPDRKRATSAFRKSAEETQGATEVEKAVEDTKIYQLLQDESVSSEQKVENLVEMMTFNFEDVENEAQFEALNEVRTIIKALIEHFTAESRESIIAARDNPLSELTSNIRAVFENYHDLVEGREALKKKLGVIQGFMDRNDNDESKLVNALSDAQDKKKQKDALETAKGDARGELKAAKTDVEGLRQREGAVDRRLAEIKSSGLPLVGLMFSPALREEKAALTEEKTNTLPKRKAAAVSTFKEKTTAYEAAGTALTDFVDVNEYHLYEEILDILDIGDEEFKEQLSRIADQTLQYMSDTEASLTGVRNQLQVLLKDVKGSLNVSSNTSEKIAVLLQALSGAQTNNAKGYQEFTQKAAEVSPVEGLDQLDEYETSRIKAKAMEFTTDMEHSITSTTEIAANVETHRTTLAQLRDDLDTGVVNANSQLLKAVSTSAITGQTMLQRTQRMAAMAQNIVASSMYGSDMSEEFASVVNDFENRVQEQAMRNNDIAGFSDMVGNLSEALDAKNDVSIQLAAEQQQLVERLNANIEKLKTSNLNAEEISSVIAADAMERRAGEGPAAPAPQ